jgi:5'-nucleotidase
MDDRPEILLTNDDGIENPGFRALYDGLSEIGNVTGVAPADDQSAVGRALSQDVAVTEHELGYAVEGTPADCVVAGLQELGPYPDLVVSGCNTGANLGAYVLGRSGTVSAAVEAAFFGVPAIAVSLYVPVGDFAYADHDPAPGDYEEAIRASKFLADGALGDGLFDTADYLNVNVPMPEETAAAMEITSPSHVYDMDATRDGDVVMLHDRIWDRMAAGDIPDPEGTDRRAVAEGRVSVSPLTAPHTVERHERLDALVAEYPGNS